MNKVINTYLNIVKPAVVYLSRLHFGTKFALLGLLFLLPLVLTLFYISSDVNKNLEMYRMEKDGMIYLRMIAQLERRVIRHQEIASRSVSTQQEKEKAHLALEAVHNLVQEIDRFDTNGNKILAESDYWNKAVDECYKINSRDGTEFERIEAHQQLLSDLVGCAEQVAVKTQLSVTPRTDTACLIRAISTDIPRLDRTIAYVRDMYNNQFIQTHSNRLLNSSAKASFRSANELNTAFLTSEMNAPADEVQNDIDGAGGNNKTLEGILDYPSNRIYAAIEMYKAWLKFSIYSVNADKMPVSDGQILANQTLSANATLFNLTFDIVGREIDGRITTLQQHFLWIVCITVLSILLALYSLASLYTGIVYSISEFGAKARMISTGFMGVDLELAAKDEIGIVGTETLNDIAVNLHELKALRDEIEEREKAEAALRESELRYRTMFESNPAMQCVIDPETGRIFDANPAACQFYGYTLDQLINKDLSDLNHQSLGDFIERICENKCVILQCRNYTSTNEEKIVDIHPAFIDINGHRYIHCIVFDITDLDRAVMERDIAEEKYRQIFENTAEGIFQTTREGRYLSANPALARIYGYESPEELIQTITDIGRQLYVDPNTRAELQNAVDECGKITGFQSRVFRKDGSVIWISENVRSVKDRDGRFLYYEGTVDDVTDFRALETEREHILREAMERADRDPLTGLFNHRSFHREMHEKSLITQQTQSRMAVAILDLDNFKFFNDTYGHVAGDDVLVMFASRLEEACLAAEEQARDIYNIDITVARFGGDEFALLICGASNLHVETTFSQIMVNMDGMYYTIPGSHSTIPLTVTSGMAIFPTESVDRLAILDLADNRMLRAKTGESHSDDLEHLRTKLSQSVQHFTMLDALVTAVDNKDRYTRKHSEDVSRYCCKIAKEMGLSDQDQHDIMVAALLHDVGKIGVPDNILRKPGKLTNEEYEAMKLHPMMGAVIVAAVPGLEETLDAVRHHHERWDGDGYPWGLSADDIPLSARIMAVADAFSAMTTDRPYRKGMPYEKAIAILREGSGTQWDPVPVSAFITVMERQKQENGETPPISIAV